MERLSSFDHSKRIPALEVIVGVRGRRRTNFGENCGEGPAAETDGGRTRAVLVVLWMRCQKCRMRGSAISALLAGRLDGRQKRPKTFRNRCIRLAAREEGDYFSRAGSIFERRISAWTNWRVKLSEDACGRSPPQSRSASSVKGSDSEIAPRSELAPRSHSPPAARAAGGRRESRWRR